MPILCFATKGAGSNEDCRIKALLGRLPIQSFAFDRNAKRRSFFRLFSQIVRDRPDLVAMEGTGVAGGLACMLGRLVSGSRYVVSSGDAVGPFVAGQVPFIGPLFSVYERLLCRFASGFIGWTPYLVGRALTFGVPRAMTAAGWAEFDRDPQRFADARRRVRQQLGIPADSLVFGIVGSLVWNGRRGYCYGAELVRAASMLQRKDACVLVVGGGTGLTRLQKLAGDMLGRSVFLPGPVPSAAVADYMAAMDVGSLPQSVDGVGSFRYTTKISEYITAGLPIVTGQIPLAYDLDSGWLWRLPGSAPWKQQYIVALADLMNRLTPEELMARKDAVPVNPVEFDRDRQIARATEFISDLLSAKRASR
jgi:glycosyltransferase involved in cell wall biosynthesis